jgi:hypothetical protein
MLLTVEGIYKDGKIELLGIPAGFTQAQVLVTFLLEKATSAQPQVLYGAWQDKMPANVDADAILDAIRREWMNESETNVQE